MFKQSTSRALILTFALAGFLALAACGQSPEPSAEASKPAVADQAATPAGLTDGQVNDIVRKSYRFVAMYNVNNKLAFDSQNPMSTGGMNVFRANTKLLDHTYEGHCTTQ